MVASDHLSMRGHGLRLLLTAEAARPNQRDAFTTSSPGAKWNPDALTRVREPDGDLKIIEHVVQQSAVMSLPVVALLFHDQPDVE